MKRDKYRCMGSKYLMNHHIQGPLEVSVAALNQISEQGKRYEKPASKADMDNLLVTKAKLIITHLREEREHATLTDKEDCNVMVFYVLVYFILYHVPLAVMLRVPILRSCGVLL